MQEGDGHESARGLKKHSQFPCMCFLSLACVHEKDSNLLNKTSFIPVQLGRSRHPLSDEDRMVCKVLEGVLDTIA